MGIPTLTRTLLYNLRMAATLWSVTEARTNGYLTNSRERDTAQQVFKHGQDFVQVSAHLVAQEDGHGSGADVVHQPGGEIELVVHAANRRRHVDELARKDVQVRGVETTLDDAVGDGHEHARIQSEFGRQDRQVTEQAVRKVGLLVGHV